MKIVETEKEFNETLNTNPLVFVDFYADWCGPCKMLGPVVEELAGETPDVTFVKVNVDDLPEIAQKYGIMSIPALFVFTCPFRPCLSSRTAKLPVSHWASSRRMH